MKLPGFIFPHVEFRFAAWIQDIMLIYHRMPILFLFENKIHTPICTRMSCSFLKVGAKASDNLTAVEVGSFSSKVLTTFVGPYSTRIWRWLVICRWERWPFWLLVIVMTLKNFFGRYFKYCSSMNIYEDSQSIFYLGRVGVSSVRCYVSFLEGSCSCWPLFLINKMGMGHYFGAGMSLNSMKGVLEQS